MDIKYRTMQTRQADLCARARNRPRVKVSKNIRRLCLMTTWEISSVAHSNISSRKLASTGYSAVSRYGWVILSLFLTARQEISGIVFSQASIAEVAKNPDNYCFVLPDIENINAKIKRLPVVSIAEARSLVLRARQQPNQPERMSLLKQSIGMMEDALRIYPGRWVQIYF